MYNGIEIVLASKHKKERVIEPHFKKHFNAKLIVPTEFDTDVFGTFTGEIPRIGTPLETVLNKAKAACSKYNHSFGIASEGSFGPHPTLFFCPSDFELVAFIDLNNDLTIVESELSSATNFSHLDIESHHNYEDFLTSIKFPEHGLIVKSLDNVALFKGICERDLLDKTLEKLFKTHQHIRLETDMRAMVNPMRMAVINRVTAKLVKRLLQHCDQCGAPGFGKLSFDGNLPCVMCKAETELYQCQVLSCVKCEHHVKKPRSDGLIYAEQRFCPDCNP